METDHCPTCGVHPLGASYTATVTTGGGQELDGVICGVCGAVYIPDAGEQIADGAEKVGE